MIDSIIVGVLVGASYALVGVGLSVIYGVLGVVNFAHGELLTLGALVGVVVFRLTNGDLLLTAISVLFVGSIVGLALHDLVLRRLAAAGASATIVATLGLGMVLYNTAVVVVGRWNDGQPLLYRSAAGSDVSVLGIPFPPSVAIAGASYSPLRLVAGGLAILLITIVAVILRATQFGRAVKAVAWNREVAATFGIDATRVARYAVMFSIAITCLAGVLIGATVSASPTLGAELALKAFAVVVCAGFGNVGATLSVGVLMGIVESIATRQLGTSDQHLWLYALLILLLLVRPTGLRAEQTVEAL